MILSDTVIKEALKLGQIEITPEPEEDQFDTSSLDLRLGLPFTRYIPPIPGVRTVVDPGNSSYQEFADRYLEEVPLSDDGSIIVKPKDFIIGVTKELIHLPEHSGIAARVEGRSTLARMGLSVHLTAPTIQTGFRGNIVLEIRNNHNFDLELKPGIHICQLIFERVEGVPSKSIDTSFHDQTTPKGTA